MFTGIVQGTATVASLGSFTLQFPGGLAIGASVSVDGVCLTATALHGALAADFDVMQQSLALTTLAGLREGSRVNVERAVRDGAEIGGHPLSGHLDCLATLVAVRTPENNRVPRFSVPPRWMRYIFAKGYVAINGVSLTLAEADRRAGWFEVWRIPGTLRMTGFGDQRARHAGRAAGAAAAGAGGAAARTRVEHRRARGACETAARMRVAEYTRGCPYHGARFPATGTVINGPTLGEVVPAILDDAD